MTYSQPTLLTGVGCEVYFERTLYACLQCSNSDRAEKQEKRNKCQRQTGRVDCDGSLAPDEMNCKQLTDFFGFFYFF